MWKGNTVVIGVTFKWPSHDQETVLLKALFQTISSSYLKTQGWFSAQVCYFHRPWACVLGISFKQAWGLHVLMKLFSYTPCSSRFSYLCKQRPQWVREAELTSCDFLPFILGLNFVSKMSGTVLQPLMQQGLSAVLNPITLDWLAWVALLSHMNESWLLKLKFPGLVRESRQLLLQLVLFFKEGSWVSRLGNIFQ